MDGIKIGRIGRKVEKALGEDMGKDIFLYVSNKRLDAWARSRGDSYLRDLEEVSKIVSSPDYVRYCYEGDKEELSFVREYIKDRVFKKCLASFVHLDRWEISSFKVLKDEEARKMAINAPFIKVD